jgi:acyl-CoA synthetase (NDP forming)
MKPLQHGRIGLVSQSGGVLGALLSRATARGVGFSKLVSTGNEADIDVLDILEYLLHDNETSVIAMYLEGLRNGARVLIADPCGVLGLETLPPDAGTAARLAGVLVGESAVPNRRQQQGLRPSSARVVLNVLARNVPHKSEVGGVAAEVMHDTVLRLAPVGLDEALAMIDSLRGAPLLRGYRGGSPADSIALAECIVALTEMAAQLGERLLDAEINPLFVLPAGQGAVAADALAVLGQPEDQRRG